MHAQKKNSHFWSEGETQLLLSILKHLVINRLLDMHKYSNIRLWFNDYGA